MKLVDVQIIYKKLYQRELVTSDWFFVIRNNSGVQIFRNDEKVRQRYLPKMYTLVVTMNWNRFRKIFRIRFCIFYNRSELSQCSIKQIKGNFIWKKRSYMPFVNALLCLILFKFVLYDPCFYLFIYFMVFDFRHCLVSVPWILFINRKLGRIRALSWYLIMTYQSHNNTNDHLTRPREGPGLNALVSKYHTPKS